MSEIFLTGASGYLGGQVLREITRSRHAGPISVLLRDSTKADIIRTEFPQVRVVIGDLDNAELLEQEAAKASIVLHLATFHHLESVKAIHNGLKQHGSSPTYWIQISGASALALGEVSSPTFIPGTASATIFDDLSGLSTVRDLIRAYPSRAVDNYILDIAAERSHIKTALVLPPLIYGEGEGAINRRSIQLPALSSVTLEKGHGVQVGKGLSIWGNVHIRDMGRLFAALTEAAAERKDLEGLWGEDGIYFSAAGEMTFGDISSKVASVAKELGFIEDDNVDELDRASADQLLPHGSVLFGTNARSHSRRGTELLQWEPREESLEAEIVRAVTEEEKRRKSNVA